MGCSTGKPNESKRNSDSTNHIRPPTNFSDDYIKVVNPQKCQNSYTHFGSGMLESNFSASGNN